MTRWIRLTSSLSINTDDLVFKEALTKTNIHFVFMLIANVYAHAAEWKVLPWNRWLRSVWYKGSCCRCWHCRCQDRRRPWSGSRSSWRTPLVDVPLQKQNEPCHEIMALFVLRKLILQTRMRSHPVELDVCFLVGPFVYFHTLSVRTAKALMRPCGCAGSPELSLVAYMISTIISWADSNNTV